MKNANKKSTRLTSVVLSVLIITMLTLSLSMPVLAAPTVHEIDINTVELFGGFNLGSDADGAYLYSEFGGGTYVNFLEGIPTTAVYAMEYQVYIPSTVELCWLYPCFRGLVVDRPSDSVEMAWEITPESIRPYLKDQVPNDIYHTDEYGFEKDLSYGGGIVKSDGWNKIYVMVDTNKNEVSVYVNDELVLFVDTIHVDVASGFSINVYPSDGSSVVPLRFKEIKFYDNAEAPSASVTVPDEAPAVDVPAVDTPAVDVPAVDTPAVDVPVVDVPVVDDTPVSVNPPAVNTGDTGIIALIVIMFAAGIIILRKKAAVK